MSAIGWAAAETALAKWVAFGTQLTPVWSYERAPRPSAPFVEMTIQEVKGIGRDWRRLVDNPSPTPGAELIVKSRGTRRCILRLQCFGDAMTGTGGAPSRLADLAATAEDASVNVLSTPGKELDQARVAIGHFGVITAVPGRVNALLEPRATADVILFVPSELESFITYIERVHATGSNGLDIWVPSPPPPES